MMAIKNRFVTLIVLFCFTVSLRGMESEDRDILLLTMNIPETTLTDDRPISRLAFHPDGKRLASASWKSQSIRLWDLQREEVNTLGDDQDGKVWALALSPDGNQIAYSLPNKIVKVHNITTGACRVLKFKNDLQESLCSIIKSLVFSSDGNILVGESWAPTIQLWDLQQTDKDRAVELKGHDDCVYYLAISPDGKRLASGSRDQTAIIWDLDTREVCKILNAGCTVLGVAFNSSGKEIAVGEHCGKITILNWVNNELDKALDLDSKLIPKKMLIDFD